MTSRVLRHGVVAIPLAAGALVAAACNLSVGNLAGRASDEWTRNYPLIDRGTVEIGNTNGSIDVEASPASTVEVRAERIARAVTDAAARDLLSKIVINETINPDRVAIETGRIAGFMIGAGIEVRYHVKVPGSARVRVTSTNGRIRLTGLGGTVVARTTNGGVAATGLTGGVDARATNGVVSVELASVGPDRIELRTTNGAVLLTLPGDAKADLDASVTNGGISISGMPLEASEQSRRRVVGRINGGGTPIELSTTNGGVRVRPRGSADQADPDSDEHPGDRGDVKKAP